MEQAGARTQQEQQRDYDIAHQDFLNQQQYPQQQIGWQLGAMQQLPYQNTQVVGDYGQTPSLASDISGAVGATAQHAAQQASLNRLGTDPLEGVDPSALQYGGPGSLFEGQAGNMGMGSDIDDHGGAGGGYLSSSGILAPYHKKLIDGLYAGGRINY